MKNFPPPLSFRIASDSHEIGWLNFKHRFDIRTFDFDAEEDEQGLLESSRRLNEIISSEVDSGIDANRIVLGGFSQGGAMTLLTGLTSERKLAGAVVLSGFLPLHKKFKSVRFMFFLHLCITFADVHLL